MAGKSNAKADARLEIRLEAELLAAVQKRAKQKHYRSTGEYVRALIKRDFSRPDDAEGVVSMDYEKVASAAQQQVQRSLMKLHVGQRASMAFVDALARAVLKYLPELPANDAKPSDVRSTARYNRVLKEAETASLDLLDVFQTQMERHEERREQKRKV